MAALGSHRLNIRGHSHIHALVTLAKAAGKGSHLAPLSAVAMGEWRRELHSREQVACGVSLRALQRRQGENSEMTCAMKYRLISLAVTWCQLCTPASFMLIAVICTELAKRKGLPRVNGKLAFSFF